MSIEIQDCLPDERHARTRSKIKIQNPLDIFLARVSPIFPQFLICEIKRNSGGTVVTLAIQTARRLFAGQTWQRSINWRWCKSDAGNQTVENCQVGGSVNRENIRCRGRGCGAKKKGVELLIYRATPISSVSSNQCYALCIPAMCKLGRIELAAFIAI